ncbi:MAG: hypothetical protein QOH26_609 [Actinomycetota bacterium]|jgi:hypothetical protein|nr:hypothetical protein [Actinomycetota bacterium]
MDMKKFSVVVIAFLCVAGGLMLGGLGDPEGPSDPEAEPPDFPPGGVERPPGVTKPMIEVLNYFETLPEEDLPDQGALGGTMRPTILAFPHDFEGRTGEIFHVVGEDGHLVLTWTYRVHPGGSWRHVETANGYEPVDFRKHRDAYAVFEYHPGG